MSSSICITPYGSSDGTLLVKPVVSNGYISEIELARTFQVPLVAQRREVKSLHVQTACLQAVP